MTDTKATIWVTHQAHGLHRWPDAPAHRSYLGDPHRHLFKVRVSMEVDHDDREVEFHDLQEAVALAFPGGNMGAISCEMMARHIGRAISSQFRRPCTVEVSEDGEVGAVVEVSNVA